MQSHLNISFQKLWNYFLITILWQDPVNISAQWKLVLYRSILQSVKKLLKEIMTFIFSPLNNIIQGFFLSLGRVYSTVYLYANYPTKTDCKQKVQEFQQ